MKRACEGKPTMIKAQGNMNPRNETWIPETLNIWHPRGGPWLPTKSKDEQ